MTTVVPLLDISIELLRPHKTGNNYKTHNNSYSHSHTTPMGGRVSKPESGDGRSIKLRDVVKPMTSSKPRGRAMNKRPRKKRTMRGVVKDAFEPARN